MGISTKLIYSREEGKFSEQPSDKTQLAFLSKSRLNIKTDILIYDDYLNLITLKGVLFGVSIKSKEISSSLKEVFDILWEIAEK